jgi:hypothetical protein
MASHVAIEAAVVGRTPHRPSGCKMLGMAAVEAYSKSL